MIKGQKGITLVALVITIIVLLILAAVTLQLTLGEHGIFGLAETAGKNYTNAQGKELNGINEMYNTANAIVYNVTH